jgi:hypothetical protein
MFISESDVLKSNLKKVRFNMQRYASYSGDAFPAREGFESHKTDFLRSQKRSTHHPIHGVDSTRGSRTISGPQGIIRNVTWPVALEHRKHWPGFARDEPGRWVCGGQRWTASPASGTTHPMRLWLRRRPAWSNASQGPEANRRAGQAASHPWMPGLGTNLCPRHRLSRNPTPYSDTARENEQTLVSERSIVSQFGSPDHWFRVMVSRDCYRCADVSRMKTESMC